MTPALNQQRDRQGFMLPLMVILFTLIIAMVAFAVDIGRISLARTELRAAVDAANLAGASGLQVSPTEARKRAKDIAASNKVDGKPLVLQDGDMVLGKWDLSTHTFTPLASADESTANSMRITAQMTKARGNPLTLVFAPLIGFPSKDLTVSAIAGFGQAADIVIVQDITSSFSAELADAKTGDQALIDALYASGAGRSSIGLAVHTGWGKTISNMRSVQTDHSNLTSAITSIKLCGNSGMPVCSGTDIASGLEEAIKIFNGSGYTPTAGIPQAIVLISDGEPTQDSSGEHPSSNSTQLMTLAQQQADAAWAQKINVFVVYFNRDGDQSAAAKVATLARGIGDFVQVSDPKLLPDALEGITKRLPMALLQ